jgi:hypothetical protein
MAKAVTIKQGEAKTVTLTVTDQNDEAVDLTSATLFLGVKRHKSDTQYIFSRLDAAFGKGQAAQGMVSVFLAEVDTTQTPGPYVGELKAVWPGAVPVIEKSGDITLIIEEAVT